MPAVPSPSSILGDPTAAHGEVKVNLDRLPVVPNVIGEEADLQRDPCKSLLERAQLFVDAVLGTGFHPPMRGLAIAGRNLLERYPQIPVVAVDLPSGWDADSRVFYSPDAYRADAVVTFTAPKLAHVSGMLTRGANLPGNHQQGPIVVAPIGSPAEAVESATGLTWAGSSKRSRIVLAPPTPTRAVSVMCSGRRSPGQVRRALDELYGCVTRRARAWSPRPWRNRYSPQSPRLRRS